jgi:hypothetical protein
MTDGTLIGSFSGGTTYGTVNLSTGQVTLLTSPQSVQIGGVAVAPATAWFGPNLYPSGSVFSVAAASQGADASVRLFNPYTNADSRVLTLTGAPASTFTALAFTSTGTAIGLVSGTLVTIPPFTPVTTVGPVPAGVVSLAFAPVPTLSAITPSSGAQGSTVAVTLTGANFVTGTTVAVDNPGITVSGVNIVSSTQITANFTVDAAASPGPANVTVTTPTGTIASVVFTVMVPPVIINLWPTSGHVGTAVTITGTGFGTAQGNSTITFGGVLATSVPYWSPTSITVVVPSGAVTGNVVVTVNGMSSTGGPYTVTNPPTLTSVSPTSAAPGANVTITGTGFGTDQGIGQVWLGSTYGTIVSWSDTQIVATVALNSRAGTVKVLQSGIWSNSQPFQVNTVTITEVLPNSGYPNDAIAINGYGFGNSQGTGTVQLGSANGVVVTWTDTQIMARVASGSVTGIARVQQNGILSNAVAFTVLGPTGSVATLAPNLMNMIVGDTRPVQALNSSGQPVTGLTWTSSDPTVVSVSTDEPITLTALAVGHVTITAGGASADVTVWADALPQGTVLWSNPGSASGVSSIVPAVPSPTGVADVFAFQNDGTVQAITADGITAWTADVSDAHQVVPDFQGGLVLAKSGLIVKLSGVTGQPSATYAPSSPWGIFLSGVHPDGTIFGVSGNPQSTEVHPIAPLVVGIDPANGSSKFSVPFPQAPAQYYQNNTLTFPPIIAGDGYAYFPYAFWMCCKDDGDTYDLHLLRVNSDGASDDIPIKNWTGGPSEIPSLANVNMITNAEVGVVLTWDIDNNGTMMATTNGTSVSVVNAPFISEGPYRSGAAPVLQAQDGSFVGTFEHWWSDGHKDMVAFDGTGAVRWTVPGFKPKIATADGGVIATDDSASAVTFDQNGNATGQIGNLQTISFARNSYTYAPLQMIAAAAPDVSTDSYWAFADATEAQTQAAQRMCIVTSDKDQSSFPPVQGKDVVTDTIRSILKGAGVNFRWESSSENPHMHAIFNARLPGDYVGGTPGADPSKGYVPVGNTSYIDANKILDTGLRLQKDVWNIEHAVGVVTAHEFGHFLLQQVHCPPGTSSCLPPRGGIMATGDDQGQTFFYLGLGSGGGQDFTRVQDTVIRRKCSELNRTNPKK